MAVDPFAPGFRFDRYEITEQIGEGGMGAVWKARHLKLQKFVVIKTLKADLAKSEQARGRFLREGEAASKIRHPNVVEIFDVGELNDVPYLVMEFLEGNDFQQLLDQRGALPVHELADIMVPVCAAVSAAHDAGVIHRDLKPQNIFLARGRDRGTQPKVLDFGISRVIDDEPRNVQTATSALLGTPRYMSPEQARGAKHADLQSDQYSLGVMLYHGAAGRLPIEETVLYELLRRVVHGEYERPRRFRPDIPDHFEAIILRAMALRTEARFPSVRALGAALLPYASDRTRVLLGEAFVGAGDTLAMDAFGLPPQTYQAPPPALLPLVSLPQAHGAPSQPPAQFAPMSLAPPTSASAGPAQSAPSARHPDAPNTTTMDAALEVATLPLPEARSRRWIGVALLACVGFAMCVGIGVVASTSSAPRADVASQTAQTSHAAVSQAPVVQAPAVQPPVAQPPVAQAPVVQAPVAQPPIAQAPVVPPAEVPRAVPAAAPQVVAPVAAAHVAPTAAPPVRRGSMDRRAAPSPGRSWRDHDPWAPSQGAAPMIVAPQIGGRPPTTSGGLAVD